MKPLLPWKSNKCCIFLCVCVCAHGWVSARACVRVCEYVDVRARMCACARVALLMQYATSSHILICGLSGSAVFFDIIS
jgi:hypothetical protein